MKYITTDKHLHFKPGIAIARNGRKEWMLQLKGGKHRVYGMTLLEWQKQGFVEVHPEHIMREKIQKILQKVCDSYDLKLVSLYSAATDHYISEARQIAAYLLREIEGIRRNIIADRFGRSEAWVTKSHRIVKKRMEVDKIFRGIVENIKREC